MCTDSVTQKKVFSYFFFVVVAVLFSFDLLYFCLFFLVVIIKANCKVNLSKDRLANNRSCTNH